MTFYKMTTTKMSPNSDMLLENESLTQTNSSSSSELLPLAFVNDLRIIWSDVLGEDFDDIDDTDTFFELGGDSVTATELVAVAKQKGITLSVEDVFQAPTLQDMAARATTVTTLVSDEDIKPLPFSLLHDYCPSEAAFSELCSRVAEKCHIHASQIEDIYPCSPLQEAMIVVSQGGRDSYMTQLVYALDERSDHERLKWTWKELSRSTAVMRTRIIKDSNGGTLQCVIKGACDPTEAECLAAYVEFDKACSMREGDPLFRVAIVIESNSAPNTVGRRYLLLTLHHAVIDLISLNQLLEDAAQKYNGRNVPIKRPPFCQYIKYVQELDLAACDKFWSAQLDNVNSVPFPALQEQDIAPSASSTWTQRVDMSWTNTFGITKSLLLRAAWAILMALRSHSNDTTFAVTQSGRSAPIVGIEHLTGPTITAIPLRVTIDPDMSIHDFLRQIRNQATEMIPFEAYGSINVRRRLGADGLRACNFQTLLLVQSSDDERMAGPLSQLGLSCLKHEGLPFMYDFALVNECTLMRDSYRLDLRYDQNILPESSVRILAGQFNQIVDSLCNSSPGDLIGSIRSFGTADLRQISAWNSVQPEGVKSTAHELFQDQVEISPKAQAVCAWDGTFSFEELDHYTTIFASHLIDIGIEPEMLVPVCFEKSKWYVVAILAVLKAGGAWIPLDPKHPIDRSKEVMSMCGAKILLASAQHSKNMAKICDQVVQPEAFLSNPSPLLTRDKLKLCRVGPENTAYVLFTSGSTGNPKGVVISHGALCTGIREQAIPLGCDSTWRCLQFSAHTFDPSISETLMTLCHGGCVCIPSEDQRLNDLTRAIRELDVNCVQLTPSVAHIILPEEVPSLKKMIFVGEAASPENVSRWANRVDLINAYGPTETCIYCSVKTGFVESTSPQSVGTACGGNNWIVEVKDPGKLAAIGFVGEIVISGHSLGNGYLNNESATSAAFAAVSWLREVQPQTQSDRIYRTGDLGYYNPDGSMQLIGRIDNQVKLRGNRIELGEIETRLLKFLPKANIAITVPSFGPCKNQLVAIFCFKDSKTYLNNNGLMELASGIGDQKKHLLIHDLHQRLALEVPDYMIPAHWVVLEHLPLNNSGKLDRKMLREWVNSMDEQTYSKIANHNSDDHHGNNPSFDEKAPLVHEMKRIWSTVLGVDTVRIRPETSFFSLGGDSLSAIKTVAQCKAKDMHVTVHDIFQSKTLAKLCLAVTMANCAQYLPSSLSGSQSFRFPLSDYQKRSLSLHDSVDNASNTHESCLLRLDIEIPQRVLRSTFDSLVQRHPMLTSRLHPSHEFWEPSSVDILGSYRLNFTQYKSLDDKEELQILESARRCIDLIKGPVFSVDIYRTTAGSFVYLVGHNLVIDRRSWEVILGDIHHFITMKVAKPLPSSTFREWVSRNGSAESRSTPVVINTDTNLNFGGPIETESVANAWATIHRILNSGQADGLINRATKILRADITEIFLGALLHSFCAIFKDNQVPVVYVERDSRALTDDDVDYSEVVGQFAVCDRIAVIANQTDPKDSIEQIKGLRGQRKEKLLDDPTVEELEIYFRNRSRCIDWIDGIDCNDFFENFGDVFATERCKKPMPNGWRRNALFEVSIDVQKGEFAFTVDYDARFGHQKEVAEWAERTKATLIDIADMTPATPAQIRAVDFPLLYLDEESASALTKKFSNSSMEKNLSNIKDIYPCTPMQEDMLNSQAHDPSLFMLEVVMEVQSASSGAIDVLQLKSAWSDVVQRHDILRTFFSESQNRSLQVVLCSVNDQTEIVDSLADVRSRQALDLDNLTLPHFMSISQSASGSAQCLLRISHALTDGWSLSILKRDLIKAYLGKLPRQAPPSFKAFVVKGMQKSPNANLEHWSQKLENQFPCILNPQSPVQNADKNSNAIVFAELPNFSKDDFSSFCRDNDLTLATIIDTAWALTLRAYTNNSSPAFGYMVLGRDASSFTKINEIMGPTVNMLINQVDAIIPELLTNQKAPQHLCEVAKKLQAGRFDGLAHADGCSPSTIQRTRLANGDPLINTAVNFQLGQWLEEPKQSDISIEFSHLRDPWNVSN